MKKVPLLDALTALGVILSLVFVGLEIRGNTRAVRGTTLQGITDQSITLNMALISVPELRSAYAKAMSGKIADLSLVEEDALTSWYGALLRVAENRFRQRQLGTYDNVRAAGGIARFRSSMSPASRYWRIVDTPPPI